MIELLAATIITSTNKTEEINKFCAYVVGIPYASDNFTDEEWNRFVYCRENLSVIDVPLVLVSHEMSTDPKSVLSYMYEKSNH
jgi:hypothetical protein